MRGYIFDAAKTTGIPFGVAGPESPELVTVFSSSFSFLFCFSGGRGDKLSW